MIDTLLKIIEQKYPLKEAAVNEFSKLNVKGMKFIIRSFNAEGLGKVSIMRASGMLGLLKMDTLIINPLSIDMPLLSYDRILAMGNDTLLFELYDTFISRKELDRISVVKNKYSELASHDTGSHWYDLLKLPESVAKKQKKVKDHMNSLAMEYTEAFIDEASDAVVCEPAEKRKKASVYVDGLLKNGGPSTDVFKKALGEEKTALLFRKVLFGTEE